MSTFSTHRKSGGTAAYPQIGELFQDNYSLLFEGEQEAERSLRRTEGST